MAYLMPLISATPAPDADRNSVGEENFAWVVETAADTQLKRRSRNNPERTTITWGEYLKRGTQQQDLYP